jgi:probable HAF family extracellular repeat protein/parallel beta-helix repeat protein
MRKQSDLVLAAVVLLFGSVAITFASTASFQGLGDLPGSQFFSYAYGISADGSVVVGSGKPAGLGWQAYRWTESTGMQGLGAKPTGDADSSEARGASADGAVVVGYVGLYGTPSEAFRWTVDGMVGLGYLENGNQSEAYDVSSDGSAVVGWSSCPLGVQAYRWTSGSGMVGLGDLPGRAFISVAYGISDDGSVVVGKSSSSGSMYGMEAFRWSESGGMVGLGNLPGGTSSYARNVSGDGAVVVGECHTASGVEAFRWTESDGMQGLGDLAGGDFYSKAHGVSADGSVIVGKSVTSTDYYEAFIWDAENGIRSLQNVLVGDYGLELTGWTLFSAYDISNDGLTIVGYGRNPDGYPEGWIATIPEPTVPLVADADGPYSIYVGDVLTLDASGSTDADDDIVSYMWDLDDDENFETDAGGQAIFDVSYTYLQSLGLLFDNTYNIHLKVTDSQGQSDTADSTLTIVPEPEPMVYYVDDDANGLNDGTSWINAFKDLQDAIAVAWSGDEIWVAEGIYKPAGPAPPPPPPPPPPTLPPPLAPTGGSNSGSSEVIPGDRTATFQLINGVTIKGGYAGFGEPDSNARDIDAYETILSGDLNGNDGPDFANNSENSYHVVTGSGTDESAVLDGFTITAGNANGTDWQGHGGGMYNDSGSPTISHCTFSGNSALWGAEVVCLYSSNPILTNCTFSGNTAGDCGGGIFCHYSSSPTMMSCTISQNLAGSHGGGIFCKSPSDPMIMNCAIRGNSASRGGGMSNSSSSPTLLDCTFSNNSANSGGAMHNEESSSTLTNCIFIGNRAVGKYGDGGAIHSYESRPVLTNCTFTGNKADRQGGALNTWRYATPTLTNCILWGDTPEEINVYGRQPIVTHCDVQGGWPGQGNIDANPCFVEPGSWEPIEGEVSYWKFDEGSGTTAYDSAGSNNGSVYGAQWTTGQIDGALSFDGLNDYVNVGDPIDESLDFGAADSFSISAWIRTNTDSPIVYKRRCSGPGGVYYEGYGFQLWAEKLFFAIEDTSGANAQIFANTIVADNQWHHVVAVRDTGENKLYLYADGSSDATPATDATTGTLATSRSFHIGRRDLTFSPGYVFFEGTIDDVRIYNRALSAVEIQQLYQNGLTGLGDYHLLPGSPCINAGDPDYVAGPNETDLDGLPRVIGGRIDMGAYEFNHELMSLTTSRSQMPALTRLCIQRLMG